MTNQLQQWRPVRLDRTPHRRAHRRLAGEGTTPVTQWTERALALANTLKAEGCITDPAWHAAFTATPRHVFVPRYYAMDEHNSPRVLVDGDNLDQRTAWLDATYSNQALITRYEVVGRQDDGLEIRVPTSSASQPSIVATMLDRLDLTGGETVLEVGAGTGYNAALLCQRLGERNVTSVDIDFDLIEAAQQRLAGLGHHPKLAAVDGVDGLPGAAYDRIVATCAVPGIPAAWINQLAMGGTIVAPLTFGGALAVVTNTKPGEVSGHFDAEPAWFMPMRPADQPVPNPAQGIPDQPGAAAAHRSVTSVDLEVFTNPDFRLWLALHLPDAGLIELVDETTNGQNGLLIHTATHTAAAVHEGGSLRVFQDGRRLWDTVETAWHSWLEHDSPERSRLGLTARANGAHCVWLDTPDSSQSWPLFPRWWRARR